MNHRTLSKETEVIEVIHSSSSRRRWALYEKQQMIQETYKPGMTVSYVARKHGIPPSQLFYWRKRMENGALKGLKAEEGVVCLACLRQVRLI